MTDASVGYSLQHRLPGSCDAPLKALVGILVGMRSHLLRAELPGAQTPVTLAAAPYRPAPVPWPGPGPTPEDALPIG